MEIWGEVVDNGGSVSIGNGDMVYAKGRDHLGRVIWSTKSRVTSVYVKKVRPVKIIPVSEEELNMKKMLHPELVHYLEDK